MADDGQSGSNRSHAEARQFTWWGQPLTYGWLFPENCGDSINLLTPNVGDGNSMTPEYKAFMVNVRKT